MEQYFNGKIFTWTLILSFLLLASVIMYCGFRYLIEWVLIWDKVSGEREADKIKRKKRRMILINTVIQHNYLYLLFWYWFADLGAIFPTSFDMICYYFLFLWNSFVLASHKIIEHFVVD